MAVLEILPDIYSVGVVDWNVRNFHGHTYTTKRGSSYNAYLIIDDKITLIDTVFGPFSAELIENIQQVVPVNKIDYIIANHVETDHSGALPEIMKLAPGAKIFGTEKCKEGLERYYYGNWDFQVVSSADKLKLGKRNLMFLEAPMIHWPDSMFTYCPEEALLLPNDAFGQHLASQERFADELDPCVVWDEAAKYYGNILWPLGAVILKKIEEVRKMNLPIEMIAPSHGVIWRKEPMRIVDKYASWAKNETAAKVVLVYETMWGATGKMARKIAEGIEKEGVSVKLFDITVSDRTEVIKEMLDARGFIFGSSTHDNGMLTNIAGFLDFIRGLKPKNRLAAVFGSYGWAAGAVKQMEAIIKETGINLALSGLQVKYMPDKNDLEGCIEFGRNFSAAVKGGK
ncbi:MAG: flavodoxin domain-containing protein [Candidatus Omnitrophota bacterium]